MSNNARIALVSGAATGIGEAIADRFERDGWQVVRMDISFSDTELALRADVSSEADWARVADYVEKKFGRLDVLVNNAGILKVSPIEETTLQAWNSVMSINLAGAFIGCRTLLPLLRKGDAPSILNMCSVSGLRGVANQTAYSASKGGLLAFTRTLAIELAPENIRVNAICPGTTETPMVKELIQARSAAGANMDLHPLRRLGTVQDQAAAAAFLCGVEAGFVTGSILSVDGGRAIR
jgi:NAD(P)-dependent dehydrogenase (short-subunit alcohol dehydrogenase family)